MQWTFEDLQSFLTELSALSQFIVAILGLIAIFSQIVQGQSFYHDDSTYILPNYITSLLHKTFTQLGISQLMVYIRPQEYYDNLSKRLYESDLANTSEGADFCLASTPGIEANDETSLVSGLVNTGNTCFLNSVLQALSSLPHLHVYLKHMSEVSTGVPLPVTRSLLKTIRQLTVPLYRRSSFRPVDIVTALSSNRRIISREQQDAQEFFQLVSGAMDTETEKITKTEMLGGGLRNLLDQSPLKGFVGSSIYNSNTTRFSDHLDNPFTGLLANRLSCMQCGYTGGIRHFSFNNIQLSLPNKYSTTLQECLAQFTAMEYLQDASCRKCSFVATIKSLSSEIEALKRQTIHKREIAKKRERVVHLVALEKAKRNIELRFNMGRIEEEYENDRLPLLKSVSRMSSKQVMLAKPPKILCLHISRSAFLNTGAVYKNSCQILFPEYLDVSTFTTNGTLNIQANLPISAPTTNTTSMKGCYYRLMSVVVHYGSHSFGHFVAFKRRIFADQCHCFQCRTNQGKSAEDWKCQHAWYRISDSKVDECTLDDVLQANPYMLLYEFVDEDDMDEDAMSVTSTISSSDRGAATVEEEEEMNTIDYSNIPIDDAAKEALRIANSLLLDDSHVPL